VIPSQVSESADLLARSGIVGEMRCQNEMISSPTRIRVLGYMGGEEGNVVNTREHILIRSRRSERNGSGSRMILCVGTAGLKDILLMQDCGAQHAVDYSYFGYPSSTATIRGTTWWWSWRRDLSEGDGHAPPGTGNPTTPGS